MIDRDALIHRIAGAIARKTASAAPAAVLEELETTHVLVPRPETMLPLTRANLVITALRETLQGEEFGRDVSIDTIVTAFMTALVREFASDTTET